MKISFVGDSFVQGTGDPEFLGWVGRICQFAKIRGYELTGYNLGVRRDTSMDISKRWEKEVFSRLSSDESKGLVFSFGVNDCVIENNQWRVLAEKTLEITELILTKAKSLAPCLFVGPPPIADEVANQRIEELNKTLSALCQNLQVPFLDIFSPLKTTPNWMAEVKAGDGAHPQAKGYEELAHLVNQWEPWRKWFP